MSQHPPHKASRLTPSPTPHSCAHRIKRRLVGAPPTHPPFDPLRKLFASCLQQHSFTCPRSDRVHSSRSSHAIRVLNRSARFLDSHRASIYLMYYITHSHISTHAPHPQAAEVGWAPTSPTLFQPLTQTVTSPPPPPAAAVTALHRACSTAPRVLNHIMSHPTHVPQHPEHQVSQSQTPILAHFLTPRRHEPVAAATSANSSTRAVSRSHPTLSRTHARTHVRARARTHAS
jgi:hypothetical protein